MLKTRLFRAAAALALAAPLTGAQIDVALAQEATCPGCTTSSAAEAPFLAENDAAMNKMMADMAVRPTGDVDRDFAAMMIPHHQGAIDMAMALLRHGSNERLKRLAQEIIVTQQQEIAAMRLAIGDPPPPPKASPTDVSHLTREPAPHHQHHTQD